MTDRPDPTQRLKGKPPTISYEIQVYAGGKWHTELVLTDRQEAEDEALRTFDSTRRPLGVRVVREEVDEKTNLITGTTVFRRTRDDDKAAEDKEEKRQQLKATVTEIRAERRQSAKSTAKPEPAAAARGSAGKSAAAPSTGGLHWSWLLILFAVLMVAGLATLLKLHAFFLE